MRKLILPLALLAMAALLGAAVAIDCVRLAADGHNRVLLADSDMKKQEMRLADVLLSSSKVTPEVQAAISTLKAIHGRQGHIQAYDALVASFHKAMSGTVDATNPLDRKFMDEAAGAINRRDVAQKQYDEESTAYQGLLNSWKGRVAKMFSLQARQDVHQDAERADTP